MDFDFQPSGRRFSSFRMRVELDVFSGKPNPTWQLSTEEVAELASRLRSMPLAREPFVEGALGYRGFVITNGEEPIGLPAQIRVFKGVVVTTDERSTKQYQDVNGIEPWLLEQARKRGYGDIIDVTVG